MSALMGELREWSATLRRYWLDPTDKAINAYLRFLAALAGSITFFIGWILYVALGQAEIFLAYISPAGIPLYITIAVLIGYAAVFASLVTWPAKKIGPMKLYFAGLLLPAITWSILRLTLSS